MAAPAPDRVLPRPAVLAAALVLAAGVVALTVSVPGLSGLDTGLRDWALDRRTAGWTTVFTVATTIGSGPVLGPFALAVALVLALRGARSAAVLVGTVTLGVLALGPALKNTFERPRPDAAHLVAVDSWAYPSGHSMTSAAVVGVLTVLAVCHLRRGAARAAAVGAGVLLVVAVGASRVYLGVHWPTDVLAGWLIGGGWLTLCLLVLTRRRPADAGEHRPGDQGTP